MKKWLLLAVLAGLALWYFHFDRCMSETAIRAFYVDHVEALKRFDAEWGCSRMTADYRQTHVMYGEQQGRSQQDYDKEQTCRMSVESMDRFRKLSDASGGLLEPQYKVKIHGIDLAPDRKTASVDLEVKMLLGEVMLGRTRGTDRLIRRNGRILTQSSDAKSWIYVE
ncbi:hypothetical protein [Lysobacter sp. CA199]|uniref:hypothetical protein n=1 Tax=Lysobacter sp. CA199 TaxID=3455608 RepID=UPI003F8CFA14